eukprot:4422520-Amphidinium_carterae.1
MDTAELVAVAMSRGTLPSTGLANHQRSTRQFSFENSTEGEGNCAFDVPAFPCGWAFATYCAGT